MYEKEIVIGGEISLVTYIDGMVNLTVNVDGVEGIVYSVEAGAHETYDGSYTIVPKITEQVLETGNKLMANDLTITSIPTYEVSNEKGTTFYIADSIGG